METARLYAALFVDDGTVVLIILGGAGSEIGAGADRGVSEVHLLCGMKMGR